MIGVIKKSTRCEDKHQRECNIKEYINAPFMYKRTAICKLLWKSSGYSAFGDMWYSFPQMHPSLFEFVRINHKTMMLKVTIWSSSSMLLLSSSLRYYHHYYVINYHHYYINRIILVTILKHEKCHNARITLEYAKKFITPTKVILTKINLIPSLDK